MVNLVYFRDSNTIKNELTPKGSKGRGREKGKNDRSKDKGKGRGKAASNLVQVLLQF